MSEIKKLHELGQSVWFDNIERRLLLNGEMEKMILAGEIRGVTSNPSIFQKAIENSNDYDTSLQPMAWADMNSEDIFFQLAIEDIQDSADLFSDLYQKTNGGDGFVSMEVSPKLAYDSQGTFEQVKALWKRINRKNLMIKIPSTQEGLWAIRKSIAEGININITLIFSVKRYEEVIDAYFSGLEDRLKKNLPIDNIASVASFFVSRVDTNVDKHLQELVAEKKISQEEFMNLRGRAGIDNSKIAYEVFEKSVASERFKKLEQKGARIQRPLWASTSTKNPDYYDVLYIEDLIAKDTINTIPPHTLEAFKDHGKAKIRIYDDLSAAKDIFPKLKSIGIDIDDVTQTLEDEGVQAFDKAFDSLLATITKRKLNLQKQLGVLSTVVRETVQLVENEHVVSRIYEKDPTLWISDVEAFDEIQHRLGWLDAPFVKQEFLDEIYQLRDNLIKEGFTHALLLGMGGSSLAPEVLSLSFRGVADGLHLSILDSTNPDQVKRAADMNPKGKTVFIVSSKSGGTTEVQVFLSYFYQMMKEFAGDGAGKYFIAITDPGTELASQAVQMKFRQVIFADPNVGGRYSALTAFGLVPAALMGVELTTLLEKTKKMVKFYRPGMITGRNPGVVLGVILAEANKSGKDKVTFITEEPFRSFGSWQEQLIAESSGKEGKGIIPVDVEPLVDPKYYSNDRLFVYLKNDGIFQEKIEKIEQAWFPVLKFKMTDPYDIGTEFFQWEFATAVACGLLGVNAFNQPDVQDSKNRTKQKINEFHETGNYNLGKPDISLSDADFYCNGVEVSGKNLKEVVFNFLNNHREGDYIAINAYLPRFPEVEKKLQEFREKVIDETRSATTLGFGPRFLHSTGQLHKGGENTGLFIQLVNLTQNDFEIPGFNLSFQNLILAQALGDYEALVSRGRRIIRIHLKTSDLNCLYS